MHHLPPFLIGLFLLFGASASAGTASTGDPAEEARQLTRSKAMALFHTHRRATKALKTAAGKPQFRAYFESGESPERAEALYLVELSLLLPAFYMWLSWYLGGFRLGKG